MQVDTEADTVTFSLCKVLAYFCPRPKVYAIIYLTPDGKIKEKICYAGISKKRCQISFQGQTHSNLSFALLADMFWYFRTRRSHERGVERAPKRTRVSAREQVEVEAMEGVGIEQHEEKGPQVVDAEGVKVPSAATRQDEEVCGEETEKHRGQIQPVWYPGADSRAKSLQDNTAWTTGVGLARPPATLVWSDRSEWVYNILSPTPWI